jgi:hypothetical protein
MGGYTKQVLANPDIIYKNDTLNITAERTRRNMVFFEDRNGRKFKICAASINKHAKKGEFFQFRGELHFLNEGEWKVIYVKQT